MRAGEAGADYVMFGEPDASGHRPSFAAVAERIAWWAEVFEVPCVGYAQTLDEVDAIARARAEFVAVGDLVFADPRGPAAALADVAARLAATETIS
jgi:thiamine-phosphate pyrophosphorylase